MNSVLLLLFLFSFPYQVDVFHLSLPPQSRTLISPFQNDNFSQTLQLNDRELVCRIESRDFHPLTKPHRIIPDADFIENLAPKTRELTKQLLAGSANLSEYIDSCSGYLRKNIRYRSKFSSEDPETIIQSGRANCIGYCSLFHHFLKAGGIQSRIRRGFYLSPEAGDRIRLIPHRWIEILLVSGERIFFDPQYQSFNSRYIKTDDDIEFTRIKAFGGRMIRRSQRLSN